MSTKDARLDVRISSKKKEMIERAVNLTGRSITDFVIDCVEREARRTLKDYKEMNLSSRDSKAFVEELINPPKPNRRLKEAADRYKKDTRQE